MFYMVLCLCLMISYCVTVYNLDLCLSTLNWSNTVVHMALDFVVVRIAALHCTWSSSAWDPRWLTYLSQTNVLLCGQTMVIYLIVYISHTILLKCCVGVQCALNLWPREWIPSEQFWKSHFFIRSYSSTQLHTVPHSSTQTCDENFGQGQKLL